MYPIDWWRIRLTVWAWKIKLDFVFLVLQRITERAFTKTSKKKNSSQNSAQWSVEKLQIFAHYNGHKTLLFFLPAANFSPWRGRKKKKNLKHSSIRVKSENCSIQDKLEKQRRAAATRNEPFDNSVYSVHCNALDKDERGARRKTMTYKWPRDKLKELKEVYSHFLAPWILRKS